MPMLTALVTIGDIAAMPQAARHPGGGGAGGQSDGFVFFDQFRSGNADMPFLLHQAMLTGLKGGVVAEWLVEQFLHESGSSVGSADQALASSRVRSRRMLGADAFSEVISSSTELRSLSEATASKSGQCGAVGEQTWVIPRQTTPILQEQTLT